MQKLWHQDPVIGLAPVAISLNEERTYHQLQPGQWYLSPDDGCVRIKQRATSVHNPRGEPGIRQPLPARMVDGKVRG